MSNIRIKSREVLTSTNGFKTVTQCIFKNGFGG